MLINTAVPIRRGGIISSLKKIGPKIITVGKNTQYTTWISIEFEIKKYFYPHPYEVFRGEQFYLLFYWHDRPYIFAKIKKQTLTLVNLSEGKAKMFIPQPLIRTVTC